MKDLTDAQTAPLMDILEAQKAAHAADPYPTAARRINRLKRLESALIVAKDELVQAMSDDFSHRGAFEAEMVDVTLVIGEIREARRHLRRWMRPRRRLLAKHLLPARARIIPQPKGVVGIIAPWNFPVYLALGPLAGALAAGNRAMIKPSELSPRTSAVLVRLIEGTFAPEEVAVVTGGADVGAAFAALPFGHLIFTGSTAVGRKVAEAAAQNLTPVTLELGGKSPVFIGRSADLAHAAGRIAFGKTLNAGQACIAPDYVLVPREKLTQFADLVEDAMRAQYPSFRGNPDYTAMISEPHRARIQAMVAEAEEAGAEMRRLADLSGDETRRAEAPVLILDPPPGLQCMEEEIFGPVLPILPYDSEEEAQAFVAALPAPLALYIFTDRAAERDAWLTGSLAGGVSVNETAFHVIALPFGGVGASGTGSYHGREGFDTFSHLKSVLYQPKLNGTLLFKPPITGLKKRVGELLQRFI
ncbi:MAG: aldehyde dehydrogenase family protein [Pseudomonadota bacterium]